MFGGIIEITMILTDAATIKHNMSIAASCVLIWLTFWYNLSVECLHIITRSRSKIINFFLSTTLKHKLRKKKLTLSFQVFKKKLHESYLDTP